MSYLPVLLKINLAFQRKAGILAYLPIGFPSSLKGWRHKEEGKVGNKREGKKITEITIGVSTKMVHYCCQ